MCVRHLKNNGSTFLSSHCVKSIAACGFKICGQVLDGKDYEKSRSVHATALRPQGVYFLNKTEVSFTLLPKF